MPDDTKSATKPLGGKDVPATGAEEKDGAKA
jgi:hypothetical protein